MQNSLHPTNHARGLGNKLKEGEMEEKRFLKAIFNEWLGMIELPFLKIFNFLRMGYSSIQKLFKEFPKDFSEEWKETRKEMKEVLSFFLSKKGVRIIGIMFWIMSPALFTLPMSDKVKTLLLELSFSSWLILLGILFLYGSFYIATWKVLERGEFEKFFDVE